MAYEIKALRFSWPLELSLTDRDFGAAMLDQHCDDYSLDGSFQKNGTMRNS